MGKLKMDLHVHTPASKCYSGENTDEQYVGILRKAIEENIDVLAITDHNTISGYKRLLEIYGKLNTEKNTLLPYKETT